MARSYLEVSSQEANRDARYTAVTGIPRYLGVPVRTAVRFLNTGIPRHQIIWQMIEV